MLLLFELTCYSLSLRPKLLGLFSEKTFMIRSVESPAPLGDTRVLWRSSVELPKRPPLLDLLPLFS